MKRPTALAPVLTSAHGEARVSTEHRPRFARAIHWQVGSVSERLRRQTWNLEVAGSSPGDLFVSRVRRQLESARLTQGRDPDIRRAKERTPEDSSPEAQTVRSKGVRRQGHAKTAVLKLGPCETKESGHSHALHRGAECENQWPRCEQQDSLNEDRWSPECWDQECESKPRRMRTPGVLNARQMRTRGVLALRGLTPGVRELGVRTPGLSAESGRLEFDLHSPQVSTKGANTRTGAGPRANATTPARTEFAPARST